MSINLLRFHRPKLRWDQPLKQESKQYAPSLLKHRNAFRLTVLHVTAVSEIWHRIAPQNAQSSFLDRNVLPSLSHSLSVAWGTCMCYSVGTCPVPYPSTQSQARLTHLLRRSATLRAYAGDTSLPGGKVEPQDKTWEDTAVRVYHLGISLADFLTSGVKHLKRYAWSVRPRSPSDCK